MNKKRFRRNSEAFFFCRKALSNLFLRVYTGMLVSKNIRVPAASRFLRLPPHHVFWQKSPYSLPLHLVHLRPPASQFQRSTQQYCHCIDNNTENLPPMHSQLFSTPADQQHSPAWKRQPFRIRRYRQLRLSGKIGYILRLKDIRVSSLNFLKICLQNGPCIYTQCFVFDQIIRILALLNCRFQCSLYCIFCLLRTAAAAAGPAACQCSRRKLAIKKQLCQGRAAKVAIWVKSALRELRCTTGSLQTVLHETEARFCLILRGFSSFLLFVHQFLNPRFCRPLSDFNPNLFLMCRLLC